MKVVSNLPPILDKIDFPPERHIGWICLVKMREGNEEAEDAWIAERPREAIAKSQAMYPDAKLVSCHRRDEITTWSAVRQLVDGRVIG